jgi:hypothetical protein
VVICYNILKRDIRNRLNQLLSLFHISISISLLCNFIYASFSAPSLAPLAIVLHEFAAYFIIIGGGFLLLFNILLYKPDSKMSKFRYQILFLLIYFIAGIGFFLIPAGVKIIILSDGTQLYPVWNLSFFLYYLCVLVSSMIFSLILCLKTMRKIKLEPLNKRIKLFFVGLWCVYYMGLAVGFSNFLNIPLVRNLFTLTQFIPILGVIFIYYGVGTSLKNLE